MSKIKKLAAGYCWALKYIKYLISSLKIHSRTVAVEVMVNSKDQICKYKEEKM